ncbi:MAG: hypothetical protein WCJ85_06290 [Chitinophagaceae bacterium]
MKYLKFFLINIVVFAIFFFLLSLLFPSTVNTSKTINIAASPASIVAKLSDTADWNNWNEFLSNGEVKGRIINNQGDSLIFVHLTQQQQQLEMVFGIVPTQTDSTILNCKIVQQIKWYQPWKKFATLLSETKFGYPMELSLRKFKTALEAALQTKQAN